MEKNKKIKIFSAILLFCITYAVFFKWLTTGNPFQASTILFGTIIMLTASTAIIIWDKFFKNIFNNPVDKVKRIVLPAFVLYFLIILILSLFIICIGDYVFYLIMGLDTSHLPDLLLKVEFPGAIKSFSIWILIVSAFLFYIAWRDAIEREQKLREENLKYKYKNLKEQVNPHFLFNSLNTLSELVYVDPKKADSYIQKLSGIYRYILKHEETDLISLDEEMDFVKEYIDLQKERTGNKMQLNIDIREAEKFSIVPVSLQILIENALKHNAMSEEEPLIINIRNDDEYVIVSNNMQKKNTLESPSGTGLSNLTERVKFITGKTPVIDEGNNLFTVKLPVIKT